MEGIGWKNGNVITNLIIHILELLHSTHCSVCVPFFSGHHIQCQQIGISYPAFTLVLKVVPRVVIAWLLEEEGGCKELDFCCERNELD